MFNESVKTAAYAAIHRTEQALSTMAEEKGGYVIWDRHKLFSASLGGIDEGKALMIMKDLMKAKEVIGMPITWEPDLVRLLTKIQTAKMNR